MDEKDDDPYVDAARWLQEVGRRSRSAPTPYREVEVAPESGADEESVRLVGRKILLSGVLALAYLRYYFLDVMVQINALPVIIVSYGQPAPGLGSAVGDLGLPSSEAGSASAFACAEVFAESVSKVMPCPVSRA